MSRIKYNKERSGKVIGHGGPRDMQLRQKMLQAKALQDNALLAEYGIHPRMLGPTESKKEESTIDMSQYMPLQEVHKKLEESAATIRQEEQARYESGLKNLNDQLKEIRKKHNAIQEELINKDAELKRLKAQLVEKSLPSEDFKKQLAAKDVEISTIKNTNNTLQSNLEEFKKQIGILKEELRKTKELNSRLELEFSTNREKLQKEISKKDITIAELSSELKTKTDIYTKSTTDFKELQDKLEKLYNKISDGSIRPLVGTNLDRPALEDKIFIDPLEENSGEKLDSHIKIDDEESVDTGGRNITNDIAKLRKMLRL